MKILLYRYPRKTGNAGVVQLDRQALFYHFDAAGSLLGGRLAQIAAMKGFALVAGLVILALVSPRPAQPLRLITINADRHNNTSMIFGPFSSLDDLTSKAALNGAARVTAVPHLYFL